MALDARLLHPRVRAQGARTAAERTYLDTLQALVDSQRTPNEMAEAASLLNPLLDARDDRPDEADALATRLLRCARSVRDARSGMACDLALDFLRLACDDARAFLARA